MMLYQVCKGSQCLRKTFFFLRQHVSVFPSSMTNTHVFSEIHQSVQQENIVLFSRENIFLFSIENIFLFSSLNPGILRNTPIRLIGKHFNVFHRKHFSVFQLENIYLFSSKNPSILRYQEPSWKTFLCVNTDCPRTCTHPGFKKKNAENQKRLLQRCWMAGGCPTPAPL